MSKQNIFHFPPVGAVPSAPALFPSRRNNPYDCQFCMGKGGETVYDGYGDQFFADCHHCGGDGKTMLGRIVAGTLVPPDDVIEVVKAVHYA